MRTPEPRTSGFPQAGSADGNNRLAAALSEASSQEAAQYLAIPGPQGVAPTDRDSSTPQNPPPRSNPPRRDRPIKPLDSKEHRDEAALRPPCPDLGAPPRRGPRDRKRGCPRELASRSTLRGPDPADPLRRGGQLTGEVSERGTNEFTTIHHPEPIDT